MEREEINKRKLVIEQTLSTIQHEIKNTSSICIEMNNCKWKA